MPPALLQCKWHPGNEQQQRAFFLPKLPSPFPARMKSEMLGYAEQRLLGFSMQQMFNVVADVEQYEHFVPWCIRSTTHDHHTQGFRCTFTVGFPPVMERYSSDVTICEPNLVKSVSTETKLFRHLVTTWRFSPGYDDNPDTCTLDYKVSFQFHSALYSHLAQLFFDQVVHTMVDSFLRHAQTLYGHPTIAHGQKKVLHSGLSH
ncbi:hypothetical protein NP493_1435g00025 [Ridgeia piscesae]|uniref:Coenzyme Q-binding protein COQ10 START domain-containing protein n=1 Tax=Ridgeia piscesae TaxID=27915 RepID=A0AAD9NBI5_RIDPI|nr:hypothetical protein NP493_1435g00025 [Ridgeia piscesae]